MGTFTAIAFYSVLILVIVTAVATGFTMLGVWLSNVTHEDAGH